MTPEEQSVWIATYGAAFAAAFQRATEVVGFDRAAEHASAEYAGEIANLAVICLRGWRETENENLGRTVGR